MKRTRGFALIAAIFLLVVLGALAFYLVSLSTTQAFTSLLAVQGARAHYAARAGLEWGAWQAVKGVGGCNGTLDVDAGSGVTFEVVVACAPDTAYGEAGDTVQLWRITATAKRGTAASPDFVFRRMQMTVRDPTP